MSGLIPNTGAYRGILNGMLLSTCEIRATVTTGNVQSWPVGISVKCMKGNPSRGGTEEQSYEGTAPTARFWVPVGTEVATGYRLVWGGQTFNVVTLPTVHADELLRPVDCVEVRAPGQVV